MKKTIVALLALLLLVATPAVVEAQIIGSGDGYNYNINPGGTTITIIGYDGTGGAVTVPTNINGLTVTGIGNPEFNFNSIFAGTGVASVTIGNTITNIGVLAFYGCTSLTNVTIPDSVSSIGVEALDGTSLTSVVIPSSVTNIDIYAFQDCYSLTTITVDGQNQFYSSVDGVLFDKSQSMLIAYPGGLDGDYTIPGSVTDIGVPSRIVSA